MNIKFSLLIIAIFVNTSYLIAQKDSLWKEYKNDKFHFCISYPSYCSEISISEQMPDSLKKLHKQLSFWLENKLFSASFGNNIIPIFSLTIFNNLEKIDLKEYCYKIINLDHDLYSKDEIKYENLYFDKLNGIKAVFQNKIGGFSGFNKWVFIENKYLIYSIIIYNPLNENYDSFLENIISNFKLLK